MLIFKSVKTGNSCITTPLSTVSIRYVSGKANLRLIVHDGIMSVDGPDFKTLSQVAGTRRESTYVAKHDDSFESEAAYGAFILAYMDMERVWMCSCEAWSFSKFPGEG